MYPVSMNTNTHNLRVSDNPVVLPISERKRVEHELVLHNGVYHIVRGQQLRPVHFHWSRY